MEQAPSRLSGFRIPVFYKISAAFALIIVFMVLSSAFLFRTINSAFSADKSEIQNYGRRLQLVRQLEQAFAREQTEGRSYIRGPKPEGKESFVRAKWAYDAAADSLSRIKVANELTSTVQAAAAAHTRYAALVDSLASLRHRGAGAAAAESAAGTAAAEIAAGDEVSVLLRTLNTKYLFLLNKELDLSDQRRSVAFDGAMYALGLSLVVSFGTMYFMARAITKPINALTGGTEKVSEGKYETVKVTSNDEIADLTTAFNLMSDKLKHLEEMRMQLMSEISHEMRTPLQVIKAGCHAITHTKDAPDLTKRQKDAVGMIHNATNRINSFVNLFLDVAKMEAGLMKFNYEPTDLNELITPIIGEAHLIGQPREVAVEYVREDVPLIPLDRQRMTQVLTNLVSNALKYTPNNGTITVRVSKIDGAGTKLAMNHGSVRVDVQDTGVGIPKADLEKLFNKFYQANNAPVVREKGSGLGLALVKHVTEAHGGKVAVASEVGVGSTFSIILPLS